MIEEVLDEHDVNFFDALQNAIDNIEEIDKKNDVRDICCDFTMSWTIMNVSCTVSSLKS